MAAGAVGAGGSGRSTAGAAFGSVLRTASGSASASTTSRSAFVARTLSPIHTAPTRTVARREIRLRTSFPSTQASRLPPPCPAAVSARATRSTSPCNSRVVHARSASMTAIDSSARRLQTSSKVDGPTGNGTARSGRRRPLDRLISTASSTPVSLAGGDCVCPLPSPR